MPLRVSLLGVRAQRTRVGDMPDLRAWYGVPIIFEGG